MLRAERWRILGEKYGFNLSLEGIGSGKLCLDIAAALNLTWNAKKYESICCSRKSASHFNCPLLDFSKKAYNISQNHYEDKIRLSQTMQYVL